VKQSDIIKGSSTNTRREIIINNTNGLTNFEWSYNGTELLNTMDGITLSDNNTKITIDFTGNEIYTLGLNAEGEHLISVKAESNEQYWSGLVKVEIVNDL